MPRKKKIDDHGTGIPYHVVDAFARDILPKMQAFFASEEGRKDYEDWKARQAADKKADISGQSKNDP